MKSKRNFLSKHFPPPALLRMPVVGVDISPPSIRFMEISDHPSLAVRTWGKESISSAFSIMEGDHSEIKEVLKKWKKEYGLYYIKATLPEEKAYLFVVEIENGSNGKLREEIEFVLEENVPLSGPEALFDYRIVGEGEKPGFVRVAVTVYPKDIINRYVSLFKECGLVPVSFLMDAQALADALITKGDTGTYLIVDIGEVKTGLSVVSHGSTRFASTIQVGGAHFSKALEKEVCATPEEVLVLKKTKGFTKVAGNDVLSALISTASVFREEIEKVYIYWQTHGNKSQPAVPIDKIILSGKDALILGFAEYLSQNIKVEVVVGNVWGAFGTADEYLPPLSAEDALGFGTVIGLALPENY